MAKANTDILNSSLTEIPYSSLERLGRVFTEGQSKYGRGNWRKGVCDKEFQLERANHALKHLLQYIHNLETDEYIGEVDHAVTFNDPLTQTPIKEDHLAKVMWFCAIMMELQRLED